MAEEKYKNGWVKKHYKVYSSKENKEKLNISSGIYHTRFSFEGKFNLLALEKLKEKGYIRTYPLSENIVEDGAIEMITYFKKPTTITLSANKEKNLHEIGVNFYKPVKKLKKIIKIKDCLEEILEKDLEIVSPPIKDLIQGANNN